MARIIISLPNNLLEQVDKFAKINNFNRSEYIRNALRKLLEEDDKKNKEKN